MACVWWFFFFQAEDGIRDSSVTGVQTCALPICTLCVHKVDRGDGSTACADACRKEGHQAILFGDLKDPGSEISKRLASQPSTQLRADLKLNTGVRFQGI